LTTPAQQTDSLGSTFISGLTPDQQILEVRENDDAYQEGFYDLTEHLYILPDTAGVFRIEEVSSERGASRFQSGRVVEIGLNQPNVAAHWLRLTTRSTLDLDEEVQDSGAGIPKAQLPFIFDRFYQGYDSTVRKAEGTGIGLALVRELLELMGGSIQVESEEGRGCRFTFRLPVRNTAESVTVGAVPPVQTGLTGAVAPSSQRIRPPFADKDTPEILIVEDNQDVIYYLRQCLEEQYRIETAVNGREGIEKAVDRIPDLIISDIMMPEVDGFELCRSLKTDQRTDHIPIILLTAKVEQEDKLEGLYTKTKCENRPNLVSKDV
jgi:CheY-like chemotaxis protein